MAISWAKTILIRAKKEAANQNKRRLKRQDKRTEKRQAKKLDPTPKATSSN
jgi:hypothetical protein